MNGQEIANDENIAENEPCLMSQYSWNQPYFMTRELRIFSKKGSIKVTLFLLFFSKFL